MKRLWIAAGILLALCAATAANVLCIANLARHTVDTLTQAQASAEAGDWDRAVELTRQAEHSFQEQSFYLHITLRHSDIDTVEIAFQEVEQLLLHRERLGEYAAANTRLITQVHLLAESESFTLKNIL